MKQRILLGLVLTLPGCVAVDGSDEGVINDGSGDAFGEVSSVGETTFAPPDPDSGTTGLPPGSTSDPDETTDPGATTEASTGSSDGGTTTDDPTGDEPLSVCDPQPEDAPYWLALDWNEDEPFLEETIELDLECSVESVGSVDGIVSILLDCGNQVHVLDHADLGPIDLAVGDAVTLRAHDSQPWWRQTHVSLLRDGVVIVAGMSAESLPAGDAGPYSPAGTFFDPLGVAVVQGVCKPEPLPEEDPGCMFLCMPPCTQDERQALQFTSSGQEAVVYDSGLGSVDGLALSVDAARTHVEVLCSDTPGGWYQFLAVRTL